MPVKYQLELWHVTKLPPPVKRLAVRVPTGNTAGLLIPAVREELGHCNWNTCRDPTRGFKSQVSEWDVSMTLFESTQNFNFRD